MTVMILSVPSVLCLAVGLAYAEDLTCLHKTKQCGQPLPNVGEWLLPILVLVSTIEVLARMGLETCAWLLSIPAVLTGSLTCINRLSQAML